MDVVTPQRWKVDARGSGMRRVAVAAACGLALAVLVCVTVAQQRSGAVPSVLDEKSAGLSKGEKRHVKDEISRLEAKVKKEQGKASKLDKKVEDEEMALRKKVVEAKKKREEGDDLEESARRKVHDVDRMRDQAQHLRNEADAARKKFLSAEKPVEMASQLAAHDHAKYRASELKVAKEVVMLSEHPNDAKIHREVSKMVRSSKEAKKKMESDAVMLKKLEQRAGSSRFGGVEGYDRLKQKSVDVAQDAKSIAKKAEVLAEKGHRLRETAASAVKSVESDMKGPDREHKQADALRKAYKAGDAKLSKLRAELDEGGGHKEGSKGGASKGGAAGQSLAAGGTKYSKEREELGKIIAKGEGGGKASIEQSAKSQYDKLEDADERKERKAARLAREAEHASHGGSHGGGSSPSAKEAMSMKRARILSTSKSTFLSGLLAPTSPWDMGQAQKGNAQI